ncbi:MAG: HPr family phosphocarrier protein [Rickettsiales bacterium]
MKAEATVEITNKKGLHARAAAKFVKIVASYPAKVSVVKKSQNNEGDSISVDGSSILGLMMLGADPTSILHIKADGEQSEKVIHALDELIANRFGEEE